MAAQKGNIVVPILSGIALVAILTTGYFFFQTQIINPRPAVQNSTTPTPTPTATVQADPNIKTYQSNSLGISFNYLAKTEDDNSYVINVKEEGSKIYVYQQTNYAGYKDGQWVEVFSKDENDSLLEAIKKKFLTNYSPNDCFAAKMENFGPNHYPSSYQLAIIDVPKLPNEDISTLSLKWQKCPEPYVAENGLSYFLMDSNHPDKFVYFSIGQYAIMSGTENQAWQDTMKFL